MSRKDPKAVDSVLCLIELISQRFHTSEVCTGLGATYNTGKGGSDHKIPWASEIHRTLAGNLKLPKG